MAARHLLILPCSTPKKEYCSQYFALHPQFGLPQKENGATSSRHGNFDCLSVNVGGYPDWDSNQVDFLFVLSTSYGDVCELYRRALPPVHMTYSYKNVWTEVYRVRVGDELS